MKIGFIGLGIMGESMCENIVKKHNDTVYCNDHKQSQIDKLTSFGCVGCSTNTEVAEKADIIITMIPTSKHVKQAYTEMLPYLKKGKICIDMSTIEPDKSVEVANTVKATGEGSRWIPRPGNTIADNIYSRSFGSITESTIRSGHTVFSKNRRTSSNVTSA